MSTDPNQFILRDERHLLLSETRRALFSKLESLQTSFFASHGLAPRRLTADDVDRPIARTTPPLKGVPPDGRLDLSWTWAMSRKRCDCWLQHADGDGGFWVAEKPRMDRGFRLEPCFVDDRWIVFESAEQFERLHSQCDHVLLHDLIVRFHGLCAPVAREELEQDRLDDREDRDDDDWWNDENP